jgi:transcriptional regulator with XRE-family HTH domain
MSELRDNLRQEFKNREYREAYADEFLDAFIGMQLRAVREQRELKQAELASRLGTTQTAISRMESVNYSGRSITMLKKIARELDCILHVSLETYGSLINDADRMSDEYLKRPNFEQEFDEVEDRLGRAKGKVIDLFPNLNRIGIEGRSVQKDTPLDELVKEQLPGRLETLNRRDETHPLIKQALSV